MCPFNYGTFRKTTYLQNHQINCLLFTEQYQSPETTNRMFVFDTLLVWQQKRCNEGHVWIYDDVIISDSLDIFKVEWSNLLWETNITEIEGAKYTLLLQLLCELSSTCCKDFLDKTGLIPPIEHIHAWYKTSSNTPSLTKFSIVTKKCMKSWKSPRYIMTFFNSSELSQKHNPKNNISQYFMSK